MSNNLISIVVPTYKEAQNIPVLDGKIHHVLKDRFKYEIIIVDDDSNDGIDKVVEKLRSEKNNVKLKIRKDEKGLSSAVIEGFRRSSGDIQIVMDADLSHPPEKIPEMVEPLINNKADFVIGSRFVEGGGAPHFNFYRRLNAWVSKMLARPFVNVKDPMAGFFGFKKELLGENYNNLNPLGFKIGLEVMVKASPKRIVEIPIQFQERLYGESKLDLKEQIKYILHVWRLLEYRYTTLSEFIKFSLVGLSGILVNLFTVYIFYGVFLVVYKISVAIGFLFSLTSNFLLNRKFTFLEVNNGDIYKQYVIFFIICLLGFAVNWSISVYLFENISFFYNHYLFSTFLGILGGFLINFTGSKFFAFKKYGDY